MCCRPQAKADESVKGPQRVGETFCYATLVPRRLSATAQLELLYSDLLTSPLE